MVKNKINSKVTIIIPTSLGGQKPIDCINSIQKFNYPDQKIKIVLVDNHTSDKTYQKIKQKFPKIGVIRNTKNQGFVKAVNQAIRKSPADYFFVTNDDIIFTKDSLQTLIDYAQSHPNTGIVGGTQLDFQGHLLAGGRNFNPFTGRQVTIKAGRPVSCDQVDGCAMLIRGETIEKIGLFDEAFFPAYGEDLDFCLRAKKAGWQIIYHPRAIFYHHFAHTTSKLPLGDVYYFGFKNRLRVIIKHANILEITYFFIFHYLLTMPIRILIRKEPILGPEIKALNWNLKNLKKTLQARRKLYSRN